VRGSADPRPRGSGPILVRHSRSRPDPLRPAREWELSAGGWRLARELAETLAPLEPDALFASPETKARQTASVIADRLRLEAVEVDELREHERARVPFLSGEDEFRRRVHELFDRPDERVFGEETAHEALERFTAGLRGILEGGAAGRPLVVTHGTVMSLYLGRRLGRSAREVWDRLTMPCCVDLGREPEGSGGSPFFLSF